MALSQISRTYMDAAIPGINNTSSYQVPVSNPLGSKQYPNLPPGQAAANAKTAGATSTSSSALTNAAGGALGKTAFLRLLVQEMTNQNPLQPANNTQFIAQLAQFSTLEQMQNMNTSFTNMQAAYQQTQAEGLLGHAITAVNSTTGANVQGTVDKVLISATGPIQVDVNGTAVNLTDILSVAPTTTTSAMQAAYQQTQAERLLGHSITAVNSTTGANVQGTVDKVLISATGPVQVDVKGTAVNLTDILSVA